MENKSVIKERGYEFALRIVKLCRFLEQNKTARVLISQLLKSGTSDGINITEALGGQNRKDGLSLFCMGN
ncbi:four helix bundle protein [bacterium]|nr:four helix bundle protein [bacterium]